MHVGLHEVIAFKQEGLLQRCSQGVRKAVSVVERSQMSTFSELTVRGSSQTRMICRNPYRFYPHCFQEKVKFTLTFITKTTLNNNTSFQERSRRQTPGGCSIDYFQHALRLWFIQEDCNDGGRIEHHGSVWQAVIVVADDFVWRACILHRETRDTLLNMPHVLEQVCSTRLFLLALKALTQRLHNCLCHGLARERSQLPRKLIGLFVFDAECHR